MDPKDKICMDFLFKKINTTFYIVFYKLLKHMVYRKLTTESL